MTRPVVLSIRTLAVLLALAGAIGLSLGLAASPAGAHGGPGQLDLVSALRGDGDAVDLTVKLTFVNDGDPVADATVTAVVGDAAAVPLEASSGEEGIYIGAVEAASGTTIRVTSVEPIATLEVPTPENAPSTTSEASTTTTTEVTTTTEATATTATTTSTATTAPQSGAVIVDDDEDGLPTGVVLALGAGVAAVAAAGIFAAYKLGEGKDSDDDVDADPDAPAGRGPSGPDPTT